MKKNNIALIISLILVFTINCEHSRINPIFEDCNPMVLIDTTRVYFKYYQGEKDTLKLIPILVHVAFDTNVADGRIESLFKEYGLKPAIIFPQTRLTKVKAFTMFVPDGHRTEEYFTFYGRDTDCGFGNQIIVEYATPVFWAFPELPADSSLLILTDEFVVKVDTAVSTLEQLEEINRRHNVELEDIYPYRAGVFILRVTKQSELNALDMANLYHELDEVVWAEPNFIQIISWP
jgi:hypothetical protein